MTDNSRRMGPRIAGLVLALALGLVGPILAAGGTETPIPLHPVVGDVLDRDEAALWGLFTDVDGLDHATFHVVPTGGFLARLHVDGPDGAVLRERYIPRSVWDAWRTRLDAGESTAGAGASVAPGERAVWPEAPLPVAAEPPTPLPAAPDTTIPLSDAEWISLVDVGYKHSTTRFGDYFTDMLLFGVAVGRPLSNWFVPTLGFQAGIGDMQDDFEAITEDGKSAHYAFELGVQLRAPLIRGTDIYLGLAGGYYMRSLRWGGTFYDPYYGTYETGSLVREQSDWGGAARFGLQKRLGTPGTKPRFLDLSIRYERYGADPSLLEIPETGKIFTADDNDAWVSISLGLIVGI